MGADNYNVNSDQEQESFLTSHLSKIRDVQSLSNSTIVTVIERCAAILFLHTRTSLVICAILQKAIISALLTFFFLARRNFGGSVLASRIANICSKFGPIGHMSQDPVTGKKRVGVVTTAQVKERARVDLARLLRTDNVRFSKDFVSADGGMRDEICTQLNNYQYHIKEAKDEFGKAKVTLSGKGFNKSDDLAIVVNLLSFWPATFYANPNCIV